MHIDDLPSELHAYIVSFACCSEPKADELPTAYVLSLVSRYWSSVAHAYKYHSLRITGLRSLQSLLSRLEDLPEPQRRVRHLSIDDTRHVPSASIDEYIDEDYHLSDRTAVARTLTLLAPTLHVLELRLSNPLISTALFAGLWALPFPYLVSLTLNGFYPFPARPAYNSPSNFPHLERLSLDGVANPYGLLAPDVLDRAFPQLVELEVRGIRCAPAFAKEVAAAVAFYDVELDARSQRSSLSLTLYLQPNTGLINTRRSQMLHSQMIDVLEAVMKRQETARKLTVRVFGGWLGDEKNLRELCSRAVVVSS